MNDNDYIFEAFKTMEPTKPVDYCMHLAALHWVRAAFQDELSAEARRRGHISACVKFADGATWDRFHARCAEAAARGIKLADEDGQTDTTGP